MGSTAVILSESRSHRLIHKLQMWEQRANEVAASVPGQVEESIDLGDGHCLRAALDSADAIVMRAVGTMKS